MVEEASNVNEQKINDDDPKNMSDEKLRDKIKEEDEKFIKKYSDIKMSDLFTFGYVMHTIDVHGDVKAVIRTLKSKEDRELARRLNGYEGTKMYVYAANGDDILEYALMKFGDLEFREPGSARKFMEDQSMAVKLLLVQEFRQLNKALAIFLKGPGTENPLVTPLAGTGGV